MELQPESATEFSIGYFVNSDKEVVSIMEQSKKAGAKIIKPAHKTFWGGFQATSRTPTGTYEKLAIILRGKF